MTEKKNAVLFTDEFFAVLQEKAKQSPRLRMNYDLRNSPEDNSQRTFNVLEKGTPVPIHCHPDTNETVVVLRGLLEWIFYDKNHNETARYRLDPQNGTYGIQIPAGQLHSVEVLESGSIIMEAKDGRYIPKK